MDIPAGIDPGDALAQPTRARLFALLSEIRRTAGTAELAERLGLRPNGVRVHLERLEAAGLLVRGTSSQPRGRPPDTWAIAPGAQPGGDPPRAYSDLGRWLARVLPSRAGVPVDAEGVGRSIGRELAPDDADPASDALTATLSALGFYPTLVAIGENSQTYCLGNCPYRDAARQNPDVVCTLHRGITRGLLDVLDPNAKLTAFVPNHPDQADCRIELLPGEAGTGKG